VLDDGVDIVTEPGTGVCKEDEDSDWTAVASLGCEAV
jgi:hypothetical protein